MVDEIALPPTDELRSQQEEWERLTRRLQEYQRQYEQVVRLKGKDSEETQKVKASMDQLALSLSGLESRLDGQTLAFFKSQLASEQYREELDKLSTVTKGMGIVSAGWMQSLSRVGGALAAVGLTAVALQNQFLQGVINPLGSTKDIVSGMPQIFQNANKILRGHADLANLAGRAQIGLGKSMTEGRVSARDMRREIAQLQRQYNISAEMSHKYLQETSHLEGMLEKVNKTVSAGGRPMLNTAKVMTTAMVAGVKLADVGSKVRDIMEKMGATSGDVAQDFAAFKAAADAGGLSVEFAREQILKATAPLAVFRKGASEAKDIWAVFAKSLREEIAPEQIGAIVQSVTQGIASMNFQTRAFVSQMSGAMRGVSALGGALRMEMNLRQPGGLARNLEMTMQAMQRVTGGGPVTMAEAIRDPSQEMRFQLQRGMVGRMMGVQGEQQQARILEVMQNIQRGGMTNIEASQELAKLTRSGEDLQRASTTAIEKMANLATRRNEILDSMQRTLQPVADSLNRTQAGRFGQVEIPRPREAYVTGTALRSGLRRAGSLGAEEAGRLARLLRDPMGAFGRGLAGRPFAETPAGRLERVRPEAPAARILAERRMERVTPAAPERRREPMDIETIIGRPRREAPGVPAPIYPFPPPHRRTEPPSGGMPVAPGAAPASAPGSPAWVGAASAAFVAEGQLRREPMNVTIGVVCESCLKEMTRKSLDEMAARRNRHIVGEERGND